MASLPERALLLSFEGPDPYAMVGGLGTRMTELASALAAARVATTLLFVGDPHRPAIESPEPRLEYRRWCQWLSAKHPTSVYDGESAKIHDFVQSVPPFVENFVAEAADRGEHVLVMCEEWQTASTTIAIDRRLRAADLRGDATMLWNANNTYGFDAIDWDALARAAAITAVSKYMKFELRAFGVDALVIPNGIPARLIAGPDRDLVAQLSEALRRRPMFAKIGRFDADKRWIPAIDAFAAVRRKRPGATLVMRGGREPYGDEVRARALDAGLSVTEVKVAGRDPETLIAALAEARGNVIDIRSFVPESVLFALYAVADAVLANSGKEPFGLVGLEVMSASGVAVCGSTGEEYAEPFVNAIVCDTGDYRELATYLDALVASPELSHDIRENGHATALRYTWPHVLDSLAQKLTFLSEPLA
jgi:glycosyltransferase involved in cell wall biosynthesis